MEASVSEPKASKRMNPTIAAHEARPKGGLHGLALAGYPPRRWAHKEDVYA